MGREDIKDLRCKRIASQTVNYADKGQEHGLRPIPDSDPQGRSGVTLKCTKEQEAACYRDVVGRTRVFDYLATLCSSESQVHIVWGAIDDYMSAFRDCFCHFYF